jgi:hypothetical protein
MSHHSSKHQNIWSTSVPTIDNLLLATALGSNYKPHNLSHSSLRIHQKKHNNLSSSNLSNSNSKSSSGSSLVINQTSNNNNNNNNNNSVNYQSNTFPHHNFYSSQISPKLQKASSVCSGNVS